jgi:hypothetical protein
LSLLFAVQKTEPWEDDKCEADMEKYVWEGSQSQRPVEQLLQRMPDKGIAQDMPEVIEQYAAYAEPILVKHLSTSKSIGRSLVLVSCFRSCIIIL